MREQSLAIDWTDDLQPAAEGEKGGGKESGKERESEKRKLCTPSLTMPTLQHSHSVGPLPVRCSPYTAPTPSCVFPLPNTPISFQVVRFSPILPPLPSTVEHQGFPGHLCLSWSGASKPPAPCRELVAGLLPTPEPLRAKERGEPQLWRQSTAKLCEGVSDWAGLGKGQKTPLLPWPPM